MTAWARTPRGIWTAPDGKTKLAWFPDLDGNVLMLSEDVE